MATAGPNFPSVGENIASGLPNAVPWTTPSGITASGGTLAQCIAATFDSPDPTDYLNARGFGFAIPVGSTINTITVTINRRSIIAGSGRDQALYLRDSFGALASVTSKHDGATTWPSALTSRTYSGSPGASYWDLSLTDAQAVTMVNSANFGVSLIGVALIANADIEVNYITVTIDYTPPAGTNWTQPVNDTLAVALGNAAVRQDSLHPGHGRGRRRRAQLPGRLLAHRPRHGRAC